MSIQLQNSLVRQIVIKSTKKIKLFTCWGKMSKSEKLEIKAKNANR